MKNLLIVESPAKAKTLKKYLGPDFEILASYGHVRDLIPKKGAVDPEQQFKMRYELIEKNIKHVDAICKSAAKADNLYLATDPDREGEAISWHLCEILKEKKLLNKNKSIHRVAFYEITKNAVLQAISEPREISVDLVDAQQARRALDYLVGFNLSPMLWKKVRRGLSAGRVQSPALRLIVERDLEIEAFKQQEYWTIKIKLTEKKKKFIAKLIEYQGQKVDNLGIKNEVQAKEWENFLKSESEKTGITIKKLKKSSRKRNPAPPFTTSTLQQESVRKLGFSAQKAMRAAQQLYEGVELGEGTVGLITYMRTDSVNLSKDAVEEIRDYILEKYGKENLPTEARIYKTKSKNAQEAHEAIRPTSMAYSPEKIKAFLSPEQFKLYSLIWKRTLACQMAHAVFDQVSVDLVTGENNIFRVTGSTLSVPGFMQVYQEGRDDKNEEEEDQENNLPPLKEAQILDLQEWLTEQHFTEPPPRFNEASLVKALEEFGIGRPSTYASIISTLRNRAYVELQNKKFIATDVGRIVNKFLTDHFTNYVDYQFTANLEDKLDAISRGEIEWVPVMEQFWTPFIERIKAVETTVQRKDVTQEMTDENCPKCEKKLSIRLGRQGRFIGCTGYPDCDYTRNLSKEEQDQEPDPAENNIVEGRTCPQCNSDLILRRGKYGKFIGCSKYPECKFMESLQKQEDTGVTCPECKEGSLVKRKSRFGTFFYACNSYPKCKYAVNHPPVAQACPKCEWPITLCKTTKRRGTEYVCAKKDCDYAEPVATEDTGT
ncbi:MAG: type I DNA topoisomerase [Gammaproteobacteria bacterium]